MINDHALARFQPLDGALLRPIYEDYSFGNLAATIHLLLTGERTGALIPADCFGGNYPRPQRVVLMFVDSFGWQFWQRYGQRSRIMRRVMEQGILTPLSALFPSTTAASVSTLNLGCLPARHGVFEWQMYVPAFGATIQSLPFLTLGPKPVSCLELGFDVSDMILERETAHHRLARHGVRSIQISGAGYAHGATNKVLAAGAETIPYRSLPEALVQLKDVLASSTGKALINFYWGGLDGTAHMFGPGSPVHDADVMSFWLTLDHLLADVASPDTLFLFTADHGHVGADRSDTVYINERWPEISGWLSTSKTGQAIWPCGSPRDMFLHIVPERRAEALGLLAAGLDGIATVLSVDDAVAAGLFGGLVLPEVLRRLGDILILPHLGYFVWWRNELMKNPFLGHHGGLSAQELMTVLGVVDSL